MLANSEKNETPLQIQLAKTAKYLSFLVLGIAVIIFIAEFVNVAA
jgi:magnesium-transporting ATPase (P-type)